jgi:hypothetical protein
MDELKGTVIVYSRVGCAQSLQAKNMLASLGLPYLDISLDTFPKVSFHGCKFAIKIDEIYKKNEEFVIFERNISKTEIFFMPTIPMLCRQFHIN